MASFYGVLKYCMRTVAFFSRQLLLITLILLITLLLLLLLLLLILINNCDFSFGTVMIFVRSGWLRMGGPQRPQVESLYLY